MPARRILLIQAHPDSDPKRLCRSLARAYADAAVAAGHVLRQVARPGFAFDPTRGGPFGQKKLGGRSARLVVTMGMPALVYRHVFRAHSVKALERNILGFIGIAPIHETLVGSVDQLGLEGVARWQHKLARLGAAAG